MILICSFLYLFWTEIRHYFTLSSKIKYVMVSEDLHSACKLMLTNNIEFPRISGKYLFSGVDAAPV